ncbi:MAG: hypothetical protein PHV66_09930 [Bacteroidales bacterium]|nr:hypothetical protein [Bacteroidales bacterium]
MKAKLFIAALAMMVAGGTASAQKAQTKQQKGKPAKTIVEKKKAACDSTCTGKGMGQGMMKGMKKGSCSGTCDATCANFVDANKNGVCDKKEK